MKAYEKPIAEIVYFDEDLKTTGDPTPGGEGGDESGGEGTGGWD